MNYLLSIFFTLCICVSFSQERKTIDLKRFDSPPKIDGIINDKQWETVNCCLKIRKMDA